MRQSPSGWGGVLAGKARAKRRPLQGSWPSPRGLRGFATAAAPLTVCDGMPRRGVGDAAPYNAAPPHLHFSRHPCIIATAQLFRCAVFLFHREGIST